MLWVQNRTPGRWLGYGTRSSICISGHAVDGGAIISGDLG